MKIALVLFAAMCACQKTEAPAPAESAAPIAKQAAPSASAAPKFARWKSSDFIAVVQGMHARLAAKNPKSELLKTAGVHPMGKDDYGMAPMLATEGTYFLIPSLGPDKGGRIMSFANADDLATTKAYYDDLKKTSAALFSWTATKDNLLLQVNGDMPEATFRAWASNLDHLGQKIPPPEK